jgi:hypothetical protein
MEVRATGCTVTLGADDTDKAIKLDDDAVPNKDEGIDGLPVAATAVGVRTAATTGVDRDKIGGKD